MMTTMHTRLSLLLLVCSATGFMIPDNAESSSRKQLLPLAISTIEVNLNTGSPPPPNNNGNTRTVERQTENVSSSSRDRRDMLLSLSSCLLTATGLVAYESLDVQNRHPRIGTVAGLGQGQKERMERYALDGLESTRNVRSYNEIMETHRTDTVQFWRSREQQGDSSLAEETQITIQAISIVCDALTAVNSEAVIMANDYQWENLTKLLQSSLLTSKVSSATTILRTSSLLAKDGDARELIGFDWGSCAYRHCGAVADYQEARAELYSNVGMLEPFECVFILDVMERSLRDIVATVPIKLARENKGLKAKLEAISTYTPLKVRVPSATGVLDTQKSVYVPASAFPFHVY
mmetsp:Transcript_37361/g.45052  ORF Transcript_37361/g.45052 Transcript_37361/m.45052 type:complete len:349 (-) Transcript_37361:117-1163(-)